MTVAPAFQTLSSSSSSSLPVRSGGDAFLGVLNTSLVSSENELDSFLELSIHDYYLHQYILVCFDYLELCFSPSSLDDANDQQGNNPKKKQGNSKEEERVETLNTLYSRMNYYQRYLSYGAELTNTGDDSMSQYRRDIYLLLQWIYFTHSSECSHTHPFHMRSSSSKKNTYECCFEMQQKAHVNMYEMVLRFLYQRQQKKALVPASLSSLSELLLDLKSQLALIHAADASMELEDVPGVLANWMKVEEPNPLGGNNTVKGETMVAETYSLGLSERLTGIMHVWNAFSEKRLKDSTSSTSLPGLQKRVLLSNLFSLYPRERFERTVLASLELAYSFMDPPLLCSINELVLACQLEHTCNRFHPRRLVSLLNEENLAEFKGWIENEAMAGDSQLWKSLSTFQIGEETLNRDIDQPLFHTTNKPSFNERHDSATKVSWSEDESDFMSSSVNPGPNPSYCGSRSNPSNDSSTSNSTSSLPQLTPKMGGVRDILTPAMQTPSLSTAFTSGTPSTSTSFVSSSSSLFTSPSSIRKRKLFSLEEEQCLLKGYKRFGPRWKLILASYPFNSRSTIDLKDKYRNIQRKNEKEGFPLH